MSRRGRIKLKLSPPDQIYNNRLLAKLINKVMRSGKKTLAQREVYRALEIIQEKTGNDPIKLCEQAVLTVSPRMEVRPRRVGGASYQVPMEVKGTRKTHLALKWLIEAARNRPNKEFHQFSEKLAVELIDAAKGLGEAVKKRDYSHKMAEANKAFAHFRW